MYRIGLIGLTLVLSLGWGMTPAATAQTTYTFQPALGEWHDPNDWDPFPGPPVAGDTAIIPAATTCRILNSAQDAAAAVIELGRSGGDVATLLIERQRTLTITDDSVIDGLVDLRGKLEIGADLEITGEGGEIVGWGDRGELAAGGDSITLTIAPATPSTPPPAEGDSFVIRGALEISVGLQNDAYVIADDDDVYLTEVGKSAGSDGFWIARHGGNLDVQTTVTGAGTWQLPYESGYSGGMISLSPDLNVSGEVEIRDGIFQVGEGFCTTGDLLFQSVAKGGGYYTEPAIEVPNIWPQGELRMAQFGVGKCD
ncbi:MAG: hypothetical protein ACYSUI_09255 [Planctomycetota bacterium]|jgi:hypothetical protein